MGASERYNTASQKGLGEIPDFLISSFPKIDDLGQKQFSKLDDESSYPQLTNKINKPSKPSCSGTKMQLKESEKDQSQLSEDDVSKFNFDYTKNCSSAVNSVSNFKEHETSFGYTSIRSNSSYFTADSDSFVSQGSSDLPIISLPKTLNRQSPKVQLSIQTSTPDKSNSFNDSSNETEGDFSFFNTSKIYHQGSSPVSARALTPERSSTQKSSPSTRQISITWDVSSPSQWTFERIQIWLEFYQFNGSWINTLKKHDLSGQKFLDLTNYQNLIRYKAELETFNDSTQSRFIHLLRKTLDKQPSITSLNNISTQIPTSDRSSFSSPDSNPEHTAQKRIHGRSSSETGPTREKLIGSISNYVDFDPENPVYELGSSVATGNVPTPSPVSRIREPTTSSKQRPFSTIESASKTLLSSSPISPAVSHGFFRRHNKSSSSESSLFTSLFNSSMSHLPSYQEEKKQMQSRDNSESAKGLLKKFRLKDRNRSKEVGSRESITSPLSSGVIELPEISHSNTGKKTTITENSSKVSINSQSPKISDFIIDRKYQPVSESTNSDKYILVTTDNINFRAVNIGGCKAIEKLKKMLKDELNMSNTSFSLHLTDFGCLEGEALSTSILNSIVDSGFVNISGKIMIKPLDDSLPVPGSSLRTNISDTHSLESKEDKLYPNTPLHYYENLAKPPQMDYLNFKDCETSSGEGTLSIDIESETNEGSWTEPHKSLVRKIPTLTSNPTSFRIIRPPEKGEINFDKRRESPFSKPGFIAQRDAPPPPMKKAALIGPELSRRPDPKLSNLARLETVKESLKVEGTYMASYAPGSTNTLIPEPYKGGGSVSPGSRKGYDFSSENMEERLSDHTEDKRSLFRDSDLKRGRTYTLSKRQPATFKENVISFEGAPELEDDSTSDDSDDGFWAKAPSQDTEISNMPVRPPAEVLYDNLEKFFPNTDLDRPVIDVSSPPASPLNANKNSNYPEPPRLKRVVSSINNLSKPQRMKTIRTVAREASEARKRDSSRGSTKNKDAPLLRRQSTKMWGRKVIEVKADQKQNLSKLRTNKEGEIKDFAWIKGGLIGKGTFGNVFLALNVTAGEMIAVKQVLIPSKSSVSERINDVIDALRSEVDTLKDLEHLNVVQYLGFEKTAREYNLFLEYVAGGSVASCLRLYGRFEEPLIKNLTSQVTSGLAYLHSRGILHRDMKADNLLLDLDGICKISDFGISKKSNDIYANDAGMSMQGTIFWMAPEVVDSKGEGYSAKVDIWSLGCVVLEMFAGRRPWSNLEAIPAMLKIGKSKAAPPIPDDTLPYVSMVGRSFLDNCFVTDARKRPTAQKLYDHDFCVGASEFDFSKTKLSALIKANEKKITV
ncbi:hypothetical protein WICMUC_004356 [Wickerhamomyces mucosus]|uniref:Protein kinase domain-containing protein n=1 Tax=Wickerhamomyces mucosus TaxID=1378264 RepID=A0A9P8TBK5_9ASCO|nr:hypothetical protein WICMUC_004356 [Wickerhamomyces mucosus]